MAVSRRATRRHHVFSPDVGGMVAQIFWYCLGAALDKFDGIRLHAACLMSSHMHYNITDTQGEAPAFYHLFHLLLSNTTKCFRGWPEEVFNKASTAAHELVSVDAVIHAIAYTIANPTAAFAVRFAHQWPGATMGAEDIGVLVLRVTKPPFYFSGDKWKDEYVIRFVMPEILLQVYGSLKAAQDVIAAEVKKMEADAAENAKKEGYYFQGAQRVLKMKHTKRAESYEVFGSRNPRFAAAGDKLAAKAAIQKVRWFTARYRKAIELCKTGRSHEAVFPYGTWWMRVHFNLAVDPPPEV